MADQLPKFIVIGVTKDEELMMSNAAHYTYESEKGAGLVSCGDGGSVLDPLAKIEVETASIDPKYVHLKFVHTNKYWGRGGTGPNDYWIHATSNQPDEDISKESCTLFEPSIRGPGLLDLTHVQSRVSLQLDLSTRNVINATAAAAVTGAGGTTFSYLDCDTLVRLPNRVVFKGDNNRYLKAYTTGGNDYLQFGATTSGDRYAGQEVEFQHTGHVRIKSQYFRKFWRRGGDSWIYADAESNRTDSAVLFWPARVADGVVALRSSGNNLYCKRLRVGDRRDDCLHASATSADTFARLRVEELVLKRNILNVNYRMMDARVYDEKPVVLGTGSATNNSDTESSMTILIEYEKKHSYSFSRAYSMMTGVPTEIKAAVPFIVQGKIEVPIDLQVTSELQWETTTDETTREEASFTVVVPPKSRVVVEFIATSGKCSVPFSYTQEDVSSSTDEPLYTSQHIDGIYTGLNYYNSRFEQRQLLPLP